MSLSTSSLSAINRKPRHTDQCAARFIDARPTRIEANVRPKSLSRSISRYRSQGRSFISELLSIIKAQYVRKIETRHRDCGLNVEVLNGAI